MRVQNLRNLPFQNKDFDLPALGVIDLPDTKWASLYAASKVLREAIALRYLRAIPTVIPAVAPVQKAYKPERNSTSKKDK